MDVQRWAVPGNMVRHSGFPAGRNGIHRGMGGVWLFSYPSGTCLELWNGGLSGPVELVASEELTGGTVWLQDPVTMDGQFWCLVTSGEPVQILADGEADGHSFHSDDWLVWEQFDLGEFFISVGNQCEELTSFSWADLKTAF